jgi:hypothetical protein
MWYLNHFFGAMNNEGAFIDQGMGIGTAGTFVAVFQQNSIEPFVSALPTLLVVIIGAAVGGATAALLQKSKEQQA